ncbi:hypothetical protein H1W00_15250 [Aeromicrobium sp. Marseille-Q0843]|uniref:YncE family protein n=1 Tax=Aeromicrobium phoceense TaxID=2754045 RepID=A0A838XMH3_9ACTN|nr:hypothetical protein [Aeromicrobium phoceense]MBA4609836.1 hypothetical protein [Aeromicrobium phoceense]
MSRASRRGGLRTIVAGLVTACAVAGLSAPAHAAEPRPDTGDGAVTITSPLTTKPGAEVAFEGSGFTAGTSGGAPTWQTVSVKLDDVGDVLATVQVDSDGTFDGTVDLPDDVALGEHWLRFLGSNPVVSKHTQALTVLDELPQGAEVTTTVSTGGRGVPAGTTTITVAGTGFEPGEALGASVDGAATPWGAAGATTPTVAAAADGSVAGARLVFAPGTLRAGAHELVIERSAPGAADIAKDVNVPPVTSFSTLSAGSEGTLTLSNLPPGATVPAIDLGDVDFTLPVTADEAGSATVAYSIPASATLGTQPLVITQAGPSATYELSVKISPSTTVFGTEAFDRVETAPGAIQQGLYQSDYSAASDALFATSASVLATSTIYKLDPWTLAVEDSTVPAEETPGALWAAYGVGVDDSNGTVWVTNTRQDTVAVYDQDDLSLVKQFPRGTAAHARDVVVDETRGRVYVSEALRSRTTNHVVVLDTETLEVVDRIEIPGVPMSLALDEKKGSLYTVDISAPKAYAIDVANPAHDVRTINLGLGESASASGVDYDPGTGRLFVASQGADNLLVVDARTGKQLADVPTGAGALNVQHDAVNGLTYLANFGGLTVSVVDDSYRVVANLDLQRSNHIATDGKGSVFAVDKAAENQVVRLTPKALQAGTVKVTGTARVGTTVSATTASWASGARFTYQWLRAGKPIARATGRTYTPTPADRGRALAVRVAGTRAPYAASTKQSSAVTVRAGALRAGTPRISGTPKAGKRLVVKRGTWTAGTTVRYRWYVGGKAVRGATKSSFVLQRKHRGKKVTVKVTGSKAGYASVTRTAKAVKVRRK